MARLDRGARACEGRAVVRGLLAPSLQRSTCLNDWWSRLFKVNLRRMCCPLLSPAGSPTRSLHPSVAAAGALRLGGLCSQTVSHCPPLEPFPPQSLDPGGGLVSRPHCCHRHHADPPHPPLPPPARPLAGGSNVVDPAMAGGVCGAGGTCACTLCAAGSGCRVARQLTPGSGRGVRIVANVGVDQVCLASTAKLPRS